MDGWSIATTGIVFFPLIIGLIRFWKLDPVIRPVVYYLVASAGFAIASMVAIYILGQQNQWLSWPYAVIELAFILYIYRGVLGNTVPRWIFLVLGGGFFILTTVLVIRNGIHEPAVIPRSVESCIVIGLCILYYYHLSQELNILHLERSAMFWITTGFLLFFCVELFFFLLQDQILTLEEQDARSIYQYFYMAPIIVTNLIIAIGLCQNNS